MQSRKVGEQSGRWMAVLSAVFGFPTLKFEMKNPKRYKFLLTLALCPLRAAEGHLVRRNRMQTVVLFESDAEWSRTTCEWQVQWCVCLCVW